MKHIKEYEVSGEIFDRPDAREIKHLVAPWTVGSTKVWMGITIIERESNSNMHKHDDSEEIFYVLSGSGSIKVGDEEENIVPGSCIYIPPNIFHQLINPGPERLRVLAVTSPSPTHAEFNNVHTQKL